jgi:hypothetical protein
MNKINPLVSRQLNGGRLIALRRLVETLPPKPKTVYRWARRGGVRGHRLPTINLGGWRYTTIQAFNQFVADVNEWSRPSESGDRLGFNLGLLAVDEDVCVEDDPRHRHP